jgi:hypothetical protein
MVALSAFGAFQGQYGEFLGAGTQSLHDAGLVSINVLWLGGSAVADIIIASTLLYLLNRVATQQQLDSREITRVERVMGTAIDTGMITAIAACIELLFYLILPNSLVHFVIFYTLPKLYANCLLATLNARLTVPGRVFRESSAEWDSAISGRRVLQDDIFGPISEKGDRPSALNVEFSQEVIRRSESSIGENSFLDIEKNFYSKVVAERNSILDSRSGDLPLVYDATVEQAYRAQFVAATEISPAISPRNNDDLTLPVADRESSVIESITTRDSMINLQEGGSDQESVNTPLSPALASTDLEVSSDSTSVAHSDSYSEPLSSSSSNETETGTTVAYPASSHSSSLSSSTGTIRLLPKIPTASPLQLEL